MNKRADITIAILVIGIVAVCFIAMISFYIADLKTDDNFGGIGRMEKANSRVEKHLAGESVKIETCDNGERCIRNSKEIKKGIYGFRETITIFQVEYDLP
jgi:hypothetical protein